jgi:hypothetical protein
MAAAGLEPASPAPQGEVSVVYATGQLSFGDGMHHRGISEESFRARFLRYLVLRDYAPIPQSATPAGFSRPCFLCRGSNSVLSPPVKQTLGQGKNARGVRGLEPRSLKSCQMYPRTPPLTTTFCEECVPYPGSPVTGKTRRIGAMRLESGSHSSRVDSRAV